MDAQIQHREAVIRAQEQERAQLEKAEQMQKKLDDAGEQLAAAQRKVEQGFPAVARRSASSSRSRKSLRRAFPLDTIEERSRRGSRARMCCSTW